MKTVVNKSQAPVKVPLPRGKSLRLGPKKEGQIRDEAAEHPGLKKLVDAGTIEIFDGGSQQQSSTGSSGAGHVTSRGHGGSGARQGSGDR